MRCELSFSFEELLLFLVESGGTFLRQKEGNNSNNQDIGKDLPAESVHIQKRKLEGGDQKFRNGIFQLCMLQFHIYGFLLLEQYYGCDVQNAFNV